MKFLFERLESAGLPFEPRLAVLNNLQRLVSSRPPFGAAADGVNPTFDVLNCALPSVVELAGGSRSALEAYGRRLQALIEHYEPRLRSPHVSLESSGSVPLRLVVSGSLDTANGAHALRFPLELRAES